MNKVLILMKSTLKQMLAGLPIMLLIYVVFPAGLVFFLDGVLQAQEGEKIEKFKIMIEDEDKTVASKGLINFFESKEISEYIEIKDSKKSQTIKILKGYESALENGDKLKIELIETSHDSAQFIEDLINTYHKQVLLTKKGVKDEEIALLMNGGVLKDITDVEKKSSQSMGVLAVSFISTIIVIFLNSYTGQRCLDYVKSLTVRENSTPNSKFQLLFYNMIMQGILVLSMMLIYITIFRVTGNAFSGNLGIIFLMTIISALFGFVSAIFITVLTPPKVGMVVGLVIMLVTMLSNFNAPFLGILGDINPIKIISDMFIAYEMHGTFSVIMTKLIQLISIIGIMSIAIIVKIKGKKVIA
ncbi:MAG: ABC transporter permease [Sarcina sp.]